MSSELSQRERIVTLIEQARTCIGRMPIARTEEWDAKEHELWRMGEEIRQLIAAQPKLRSDAELHEAFLQIAVNRAARRGRQPFVTLLATPKAASLAEHVATELDDADVCGQVIDALTKMRVAGFTTQIRPFCDHSTPWIRNKAQAYCERYA